MQYTRIDTDELKAAVAKAAKKVDEAAAILAPYLVLIDDEQRAKTPRAREGFPDAARSLSRAMKDHPKIAAASDYDGEAVNEDLDNVAALVPFLEKLAELSQRVADSKLVWLAEAWVPSLTAYGVAKAASKTNAALRTVVQPLADIFATARSKQAEPAPQGGADAE